MIDITEIEQRGAARGSAIADDPLAVALLRLDERDKVCPVPFASSCEFQPSLLTPNSGPKLELQHLRVAGSPWPGRFGEVDDNRPAADRAPGDIEGVETEFTNQHT